MKTAPDRHPPASRVWVINADCELEFDCPSRANTDLATQRALRERWDRFAPLLSGDPGFLSFAPPTERFRAAPRAALWSPTPLAQRAARRAGLTVPPAPSFATLQRVNEKAFLTLELKTWTHPDRTLIHERDDWGSVRRSTLGPLRLRRAFGFAGRGARRIPATPNADDERFVADSLRKGYLVCEPEVPFQSQWSMHGVVHHGDVLLGSPCTLLTDIHGAPVSVTRAPACPFASELFDMTHATAEALKAAQYHGPFGIDAIADGTRLYAIDLNARFTLGFSTGMGSLREEALALLECS